MLLWIVRRRLLGVRQAVPMVALGTVCARAPRLVSVRDLGLATRPAT